MISQMDEKQLSSYMNSKMYELCSTAQKTKRDQIIMNHRIQSFTLANRQIHYQLPTTPSSENFHCYYQSAQENRLYQRDQGIMGYTKEDFFNMINLGIQNNRQPFGFEICPKQLQNKRKQQPQMLYKKQEYIKKDKIDTKMGQHLQRKYIKTNIKLGQGAESVVYEGFNQQNNQKVAIKVLVSRYTDNEIKIMQGLGQCENVLRMYDHWIQNGKMCIALELCDGTLGDIKNGASLKQRYQYFSQILNGMKHLDRKGVLHRDIKLYNILVKNNVIKLSDFGFAKYIGARLQVQSKQCGTPATMAPQVLFAQRKAKVTYDRKSDIWPLGVILHELVYDCHPFDYDPQRVQKNRRIKVKKPISGIQTILDKILISNIKSRINLYDLMKIFNQFLRQQDSIEMNIEYPQPQQQNISPRKPWNNREQMQQMHQHQIQKRRIKNQLLRRQKQQNLIGKRKEHYKNDSRNFIEPDSLYQNNRNQKERKMKLQFNHQSYDTQSNIGSISLPQSNDILSNKTHPLSKLGTVTTWALLIAVLYIGKVFLGF